MAKKRSKKTAGASAPGLRFRLLPHLALPVARGGISSDPFQPWLAAAGLDRRSCIDACSRLGGSFRGVCESMCDAIYGQR